MTKRLQQLLELTNGYADQYDARIEIVSEEPLVIKLRTEDDEHDIVFDFELREEPEYQGRLMFSIKRTDEEDELFRTYFSGSGSALFGLLYA